MLPDAAPAGHQFRSGFAGHLDGGFDAGLVLVTGSSRLGLPDRLAEAGKTGSPRTASTSAMSRVLAFGNGVVNQVARPQGGLLMKPKVVHMVAAMASLAALSSPAQAGETHKAKLLQGIEETPAIITGAGGSFKMDIANDDASFTFELTYEGLENPVTQAHIHVGQA